MKSTVTAALQRLRDILTSLTVAQKATMAVAAIALVALFWAFSTVQDATGDPDGTILFAGLPPEVAADVTAALEERTVTYELADGGRTVYVDPAEVYRLRVELAGLGLPAAGPAGYDLLEAEGITTSEFRQRVDYQRALEGELSRTIAAFAAVEDAIVRLALPDDNAFVTGQTDTTASVLLETVGDVDEQTVTAILHLVAGAVPDLDLTGVTITDAAGTLLSADGQTTGTGGSNDEREQAIGAALAAGAEELLAAAFGPGNARVTVRAELDFSTSDTTSETYGDQGVVASESVETESYLGEAAAGDAEILGELLNDPAGIDGPDDGLTNGELENIDYDRDSADRNYAVDRVTQQVSNDGGTIDRLTVAVLVNDTLQVEPAAIQAVVANAVGVNVDRGDDIEVLAVPFADTTPTPAVEPEPDNTDLIRLIVVAVVVIASLLVAGWMLAAGRRTDEDDEADDTDGEELAADGSTPLADGDLDIVIDDGEDDEQVTRALDGDTTAAQETADSLAEAMRENAEARAAAEADTFGTALAELDMPIVEEVPPAITQLVEEDPHRVAELLKLWLEER